MIQESTAPASRPKTLLFIDDEANVLSALHRLFLPFDYNILTAESGADALALMEKEPVDLVICDMRMPVMTGDELLEQIRNKWPDVVRILLTGYSDLKSTIAAINRGGIYRYIAKPWNADDTVLVVRDALEHKQLLDDKKRLEALTLRQNDELKELNASLEDKVQQRTVELRIAHEHLKKDYFTTLQIFSNLMELRKGTMAGHSRRVAQLCRDIAHKMRLSDSETKTIETAALMHNIGKIGLPDRLLEKPYMELLYAERVEFDKHPQRAAAALMALDPLSEASALIRCHRDLYDGVGNTSGLRGEQLPLGARILLVASDFDALQQGLISNDMLSPEQALEMIVGGRNKRYDPIVVDVFRELMSHVGSYGKVETEFHATCAQLREGIALTRDVVTNAGMLLLMKGSILSADHIREIREYEQTASEKLTIYTHTI